MERLEDLVKSLEAVNQQMDDVVQSARLLEMKEDDSDTFIQLRKKLIIRLTAVQFVQAQSIQKLQTWLNSVKFDLALGLKGNQ